MSGKPSTPICLDKNREPAVVACAVAGKVPPPPRLKKRLKDEAKALAAAAEAATKPEEPSPHADAVASAAPLETAGEEDTTCQQKLRQAPPQLVAGATVFWITNLPLNKIIGRFERSGAIPLIQDLVNKDAELREAHIASHAVFSELAERYVPGLAAQQERQPVGMRKFGNAGVSEPGAVKCLHALVASAMAGAPNPIGTAVVRHIEYLGGLLDKAEADLASASAVGAYDDDDDDEQGVDGADGMTLPPLLYKSEMDDVQSLVRRLATPDARAANCVPVTCDDATTSRICDWSLRLIVAAEGHGPRIRRKRRRN